MFEAFDRLGEAAILLTGTGSIAGLNRKAKLIFDDLFVVKKDVIATKDVKSGALFNGFLKNLLSPPEMADGSATHTAFISRSDGSTLIARGYRTVRSPGDRFHVPHSLLLISDSRDTRIPASTVLKDMYGLTRTEAGVAVALSKGHDTTTIANSLNIQSETVRLHIKRILAKTRTSRQVELVSTLKDLAFSMS